MTMKSLNTAISFCAPNVSMLLVICTYWALGNSLSIALVFSTLALIHVLRLTIGKNLCFFFEQVGEARTSLKRIEHFLLMEERSVPINPERESNFTVVLNRASFKWNSSDTKMALKNISISINKEDLCVVSGPTGCGKSALLQAILGELSIDDPASMTRLPDMAYACQKAWIMSGTVKSNIVWGACFDFDKNWYDEVVASCCLDKDLNQLPDRDLTEIGEKGVNLSGGQRARIGLARAVYARKSFLLLDDVLAACDAKVAHTIFHNCVLKLLKHNCVILVTHNKTYESYANICVEMKDGTVSRCFRNEKPLQVDPAELSIDKNGKDGGEKANDEDEAVLHVLVPEEERVKGKIGKGTFLKYLRSAGDGLVFFVAILLISAQIVSFGAEFTLKQWTESSVSRENTTIWLCLLL